MLPRVEHGKTVSCLQVGQASVSQKDVTEAKATNGVGSAWDVDFVLDTAGADALNRLAAAQLGKELAIEVGGVVYSAPQVHTGQFNGRGAINGLDEATAKHLASEMKSS